MNLRSNSSQNDKTISSWVILIAWIVLTAIPMSYLMPAHLWGVDAPDQMIRVEAQTEETWVLNHIIYSNCPCSQGVADYLLSRPIKEGIEEQVWLIDGSSKESSAFEQSGFKVNAISAAEMKSLFGSQIAPYFQVINREGTLLYSGSYLDGADRNKTNFKDLFTLSKIQNNQRVKERPVFGCATSLLLQQTLDPFSLKYK